MCKVENFLSVFTLLLLILVFSPTEIKTQTTLNSSPRTIRFKVTLSPDAAEKSVSGRLLILMTAKKEPVETIDNSLRSLFTGKVWTAAVEVKDLMPGKTVEIDPDALAFPTKFSAAPPGDYQIMALLDANNSYGYSPYADEGDIYSPVMRIGGLAPAAAAAPIELTLSQRIVKTAKLTDTDSVKLVTFQSPALSRFWKKPITMRAGIVLPPGYANSPARRYPTAFFVHGYGGSLAQAWRDAPDAIKQMTDGKMPEMIRVYLDAVFPSGHHAFADSENNGPWATALVKEFIPFLEGKFRMDAVPQGRLLTGHSSGGWSTLWLQINYPDFFGGVWASSPDPVDFRSFLNVDLTKNPPENFYRAADKTPRNVLRYQMFNLMNLEDYARREQAFAAQGGQLASFEAVFSPRGKDGLPLTLFDRATGAIDPDVQKAWERLDISRFLKTNWKRWSRSSKEKSIFSSARLTIFVSKSRFPCCEIR